MATALGTFADALGFGLLNDVLASFNAQTAYGRPNLYEVQIHSPRGASPAMGGHNVREISLLAESLQMPGRSLQTQIASAGAVTGPQRALSSNRAQFILKTYKSFKHAFI